MNEQSLMELFLSQIKGCGFDTKVSLSDPVPFEDGKGNNTRVTAVVTGSGFKPYKLWYDYHRPHFKKRMLPIELIYEDEEDDISTLATQLIDGYGINADFLLPFPLTGAIKKYLRPESPLGHYLIKIDNYECTFEQEVEFAPRKLDVRYIFNEIVTIKDNDIVFRHERQEKELENHIPVWVMMKNHVDGMDKQEFKLNKDTKPKDLVRETFVSTLYEENINGH